MQIFHFKTCNSLLRIASFSGKRNINSNTLVKIGKSNDNIERQVEIEKENVAEKNVFINHIRCINVLIYVRQFVELLDR